jgi:hypothetical protein
MRTVYSQRPIANWVIPIVLAICLTSAARFAVVHAAILLGDLSSLATQSRHSAPIQP